MTTPTRPARFTLAAAAAASLAGPASAQVVFPPKPDSYHVDLRYRIRADRDERVIQFRGMAAALKDLGFVADPRDDADLDVFDPVAERLAGTISAANAMRLLDDPRIKTILLTPAGTQPPADPGAIQPVRIELGGGLDPVEQRKLHAQVVRRLEMLGFRDGVGYDHAGFTRVRGGMPAVKVPVLLKDLRDLPAGWFAAETPRDRLEQPLKSVLAVRSIEVLPPIDGLDASAPAPALGKLSQDVKAALADPASAGKPVRVEVAFDRPVEDGVQVIRTTLRTQLPGAFLEGAVGSVATFRFATPADVERFAQLPLVTAVRLPRAASLTLRPGAGKPVAGVLSGTNVSALHAAGYRGAGAKIVVVGPDFSAAAGLIGKQLPRTTRVIDLTAEISPTVEPMPAAPGLDATAAAVAAAAAAPDAEVVLVRIDPSSFHELFTVARAVAGFPGYSEAIRSRVIDLTLAGETLSARRDQVQDQYRKAFADLSDDDKPAALRKAAQDATGKLKADEAVFNAAFTRLQALKTALDGLTGATVVVNTLVWEVGAPVDGLSELSRFLDAEFAPRRPKSALTAGKVRRTPGWVQAASESAGGVWAGAFLDADANGVMEFSPPGSPRVVGTWSRELNFLELTAADGKTSPELAAGTKLRVAVQWREPRNAESGLLPEPAFSPTLKLLRQLDPAGAKVASDELAEVARSIGQPVRLMRTDTTAVYEQTLELTVAAAGRYAMRVEGRAVVESPLPALVRGLELQPRIYVQAADGAPKVGFATYAPLAAGVGVPGDAAAAVTVGVGVGLTGGGPGVLLRAKPDVTLATSADAGGKSFVGSGVSASVVAGLAACLAETGVSANTLPRTLGVSPGGPLAVSADWIRSLPRK